MKSFAPLAFAVFGTLFVTGSAFGSTNGTDNAGNYSSWTNGSNAGTGFGAWSLTSAANGGFAGFFLGDSTTLGGSGANSGGANINSSNTTSFGMYANGNSAATANATRSFAGGALATGQTFALDIAVNFRNGSKGVFLADNSGATLFTFNVTGDDYIVSNAASNNGSIGNTYSANTAFHLEFAQTSATGGTWTITRSGGVTDSDTGTYSGDGANFGLFVTGTGSGDQNNFFANNLSLTGVPEPATWLAGLLVCGTAGVQLARSHRRKQKSLAT